MTVTVKKAVAAWVMLYHLISAKLRLINAPTTTNAPPVAHGGIDAMIGAKKILKKKYVPMMTAVNPVRAPASTPDPDSIYDVTGVKLKILPNIVANASAENANRERGKSPFSSTNFNVLANANKVPYAVGKKTSQMIRRSNIYNAVRKGVLS